MIPRPAFLKLEGGPAPLLPRASAGEPWLMTVIAVLCFLACLAAVAASATERTLLDAAPGRTALVSGMAGSRQGWIEAPYVACPASAEDIAAAAASGISGVTETRMRRRLPGSSGRRERYLAPR